MSAATAIWHDVECGGYEADLPLWEEMVAAAGGPILDLGCGTGRVALHLAGHGHEVTGLDREPELVAELSARAGDLSCRGEVGDARDFALERRDFALVLAPMQLLQLFSGPAERTACLAAVAEHLRPGGVFAAAIVEEVLGGFNRENQAVPDSREVDGRVYASLPIETAVDRERITIRRLRKVVSPAGVLERSDDQIVLRQLSAATLEAEAAAVGLAPIGRREIPPTLDHVGSTVVLLERPR
ncbi:MAG TPA: class I SAM-dependent methyltransferase [Solirubrobacterales bacterium]|nr:class I SAM-dependent methyltransferase [Solirubrobacterales bacterium]